MSRGLFITFEGTEGGGKSTQIQRLARRLEERGRAVRQLREPGGTPVSEEIRHLVKHSANNAAMIPEAELLLICAARAQLVREVIRPVLAAGTIVLCDRFMDSTTAYQGYGRQLDLARVRAINEFAVGDTQPDLTLVLHVPLTISESRRRRRPAEHNRDRMEEAGRDFFQRVEEGYRQIAAAEPQRVRWLEATGTPDEVESAVWREVSQLLR